MPKPTIIVLALLCGVGGAAPAASQTTEDLRRMSLEQLLDIKVTTVSRVPEQTFDVPAAVFVITQDDIRRSGATSIPEALRLAPGVQVARISGGTWAIGIRGFADRLARSMLVLIDGRAVYSPLFAGTYWETQDTLLSDVDRIEVIRGPGGTLWGANAVNGIINIITKAASETTGVMASAGGGSEDRAFGAFRYGATSGRVSYRMYAKGLDRDSEYHRDGNSFDGWRVAQGGGRADWALANQRTFTVQGDVYDGRLGERPSVTQFTPPFTIVSNERAPLAGGNVLARFSGDAGRRATFQLQTYYDRTHRDEVPVAEDRDTFDVDAQSSLRDLGRHVVVFGGGYRLTAGRITTVGPTTFTPNDRTDTLLTAFAQDEVSLVPGRWRVTLGSKFEHNDYSGFEVQPTARLLWTPDQVNTAWAAVTRAVRTPSRVETDYSTTSVAAPAVPAFVRLLPNPAFEAEKQIAYEVGYRVRPRDTVYVTASLFYNHLRDLLSTELSPPFAEGPPLRLILPVDFENGIRGESYGAELTADLRPAPWWRITGNYSFLDVNVSKVPGGRDVSQEQTYEGTVPHHQVQAGSSFDVGSRWSIDGSVRRVSALRSPAIAGYTSASLRLGWQPMRALELSIVGRDLLDAHHPEWAGGIEVQRSVYGRITWRH